MDVWRITVAALRRWYVLLPLLGVTALMVLAAGRGVQAEYEVTGTTMLVPGRAVPQIPNPYGSPDDANNAVVIVLNSSEVRGMIAEQGLEASYEVAPQSRSTIMNFQVRSVSPEVAVETGIGVFQMAATELRDRQTAAGVRLEEQYNIDVLQTPSVSAAVTDGKMRNMAVVGVLGGAISLAVAVFFDDVVGLLMRRRRRRKAQGRQEAELSAGPSVEPEGRTEARAADDHVRTSAGPVERHVEATPMGNPKRLRGSGRRPGPTNSKQPRKVKKAAAAGLSESASSASRGTAVSDAP